MFVKMLTYLHLVVLAYLQRRGNWSLELGVMPEIPKGVVVVFGHAAGGGGAPCLEWWCTAPRVAVPLGHHSEPGFASFLHLLTSPLQVC